MDHPNLKNLLLFFISVIIGYNGINLGLSFRNILIDEIPFGGGMNNPGNLEQGDLTAWQLRHLVKSGLFPDENVALRSALRALFQVNPDTRVRMVVSAYQSAEISLGKAAAMLGVSQEEMKDILREAGIEIFLGPQTVEEIRKDADNA